MKNTIATDNICPLCNEKLINQSSDGSYWICPTTLVKSHNFHYRMMTSQFDSLKVHFATVLHFKMLLDDKILTVSSIYQEVFHKENADLQDFVKIYHQFSNLKAFS